MMRNVSGGPAARRRGSAHGAACIVDAVGRAGAPAPVSAQRARPAVVGLLSPWGAALPAAGQREPFERGLRALGWTPGATVILEQRFAEGKPEQLPGLAAELVRLRVDVIVAHGSMAVRAARDATRTISIAMAAAGDPLREGLVSSPSRPDGNITGLTFLAPGRINRSSPRPPSRRAAARSGGSQPRTLRPAT